METRRRILVSWSTGKDSAWMVHVLRRRTDIEIVGLLTTLNQEFNRVAMHGVRHDLLRAQADALELPLLSIPLPWPCSNEEYERLMAQEMVKARADGITGIAFGDLFLADVRAYREQKLAGSGIEPIFPIWGKNTKELAREVVNAGIEAYIVCLDPRTLDRRFAGKRFDHAFLDALPAEVDPCGERGEFHTFVAAGPMFKTPIPVRTGDVVERDGFIFTDVLLDAIGDASRSAPQGATPSSTSGRHRNA